MNLPAPPQPVPQPAPPTSRRRWLWLFILAVVVLALVNSAAKDEPLQPSEPVDVSVTAEMVADTISTTQLQEFCDAYFGIGDYGAALEAFEDGYTELEPTAEEVFDELLTRC